jgi:hypothetical protein
MKAFTSIFRNGRLRLADVSTGKRPGRIFASSFAALEGRVLLSVAGPVLVPTTPLSSTTSALIATTSIPFLSVSIPGASHPGSSPTHVTPPGSSGSTTNGDDDHHTSPTTQPSQVYQHVALDEAEVAVDGLTVPEFALADFNASDVLVRVGFGGKPVELGPLQGINHPDSVTLADINDDGIPDLIVANTNGNNVLIFPGLGNGQFGPEEFGGAGLTVGSDPIGVTVNYVDGDPSKAQLIVANAESNSVSIIDGQAFGGIWSATAVATIATPSLPVKTLLYDVNDDGNPDLLVCNSGSDDVTLYEGLGGGSFEATASATFVVGSNPDAMFVGPFERRGQEDLVTVNAGSDDVTFIGGAFGPDPITQTISSGGIAPDAAFALDPGHSGVMDLVVANGGDGHMAVFRGGSDGPQLAGVIAQASVPDPTALVPGSSGGDGFDFFAAGAGNDVASLLHFDLGVASTYLPGSLGESGASGDGDLIAELMPFGDSSLSLIAALWAGVGDPGASTDEWTFRDPLSLTSLYAPTEGQGSDEPRTPPESSKESPPPIARPVDPSKVDDTRWARWVFGVDQAIDRPRGFLDVVAARDLEGGVDRPVDGLARLVLDPSPAARPFDPDVEAASAAVDEALRLFWSEGATREGLMPAEPAPKSNPAYAPDGIDAALEVRLEAVPVLSSAVLVSTGLILRASPPRPPLFRRKPGPEGFVNMEHDRRAGGRPGPV